MLKHTYSAASSIFLASTISATMRSRATASRVNLPCSTISCLLRWSLVFCANSFPLASNCSARIVKQQEVKWQKFLPALKTSALAFFRLSIDIGERVLFCSASPVIWSDLFSRFSTAICTRFNASKALVGPPKNIRSLDIKCHSYQVGVHSPLLR